MGRLVEASVDHGGLAEAIARAAANAWVRVTGTQFSHN